ncbi:hypothetical protein Acr_09g0009220 [Actinidia rufa]|uniref:Uncharacterized protein n=1 Tax=Actinidia rufa TaxID=165716 RepID=A0A7J0F7T0_9ERIC|nr:hypothetical protein Acr_09g0009220 [Actinidia rufa]
MTDWKTEDDNEMVKDTHGGGVSHDRMMIEAEIEKEELDHPEETHEGSPHSNAGLTGDNKSPPFEATKVLNNHGQNIVATAELHAQKHLDHPEDSTKHEDSTEKADGKHLDPSIHSDSIVPVERSLKTQTEDEMVHELKKGLTGKEFDEVNATEEEELNYGGTTTDLPQKKTKDKSQMEFPPDNEIMEEELNVGVTESQLRPELQNAVTRTDLPLDNKIQEELKNTMTAMEMLADNEIKDGSPKPELDVGDAIEVVESCHQTWWIRTGCDRLTGASLANIWEIPHPVWRPEMAPDLAISRISSPPSLHLPGLATILLSLISSSIGLQIQPQPEMGRTGVTPSVVTRSTAWWWNDRCTLGPLLAQSPP